MMNVKYYHEFIGADDVLNRFEILCDSTIPTKKIEATNTPFCLEYLDARKLEPVQGSQVTLGLISESFFQFMDLHTDDMQGYLIKFYRAGQLYWIGYLDSELYSENLTDSPPYPVEFSGADFNILERLKFRNGNEKSYADINTLLTQLKRCLDKLGLPFQKLYIGCSTAPEGIILTSAETALHKLYIQSSNFYDEDNEPMSCREVVESILQPFGLMMAQRDASVYIYDLNTIKSGGAMKCYSFASLAYIGDTAVNVQLGDISDIGTMSTNASLGFDEMINNVSITSSLYASKSVMDYKVEEAKLADLYITTNHNKYIQKSYRKCDSWNANDFTLFFNKENDESIMGAGFAYTADNSANNSIIFENNSNYLISSDNLFLRIKVRAYINARLNPFDEKEKIEFIDRSYLMRLYCRLVLLDDKHEPLMYFDGQNWVTAEDGGETETLLLYYSEKTAMKSILNKWITNSKMSIWNPGLYVASDKDYESGIRIHLPNKSGYIHFELLYCLIDDNERKLPLFPQIFPADKIYDILINDTSISIEDVDGNELTTDDYEFKSYINKKVSSDFEKVSLKCISANEDKLPIGRANILKKIGDHYELQLSYTRAGQTDILERLLMSTIHSNFTTKNKVISVDIKMTENPVLRYVTYNNVLHSDGMFVTGATLDFHDAKTTVKAVEFSADTDKLSNIPYE